MSDPVRIGSTDSLTEKRSCTRDAVNVRANPQFVIESCLAYALAVPHRPLDPFGPFTNNMRLCTSEVPLAR